MKLATAFASGALLMLFGRSARYHLMRRAEFAETLRMQHLASDDAVTVAVLIGVVEAGAATFAAVSFVWRDTPTSVLLAGYVATAVIGLGLFGHVVSLLRREYRGTCGCTVVDAAMSRWSVVPSIAVVVMSLLGAATCGSRVVQFTGALFVVALQGVVFALLVELLAVSTPPSRIGATR